MLQNFCDLIEAVSECQTLIRHLETERNDISIYNILHDEAVDIVLSFLSRGQRNRANQQVADTKYFTALPIPRSLVKRVKASLGEIRRSGTVIDTDQFQQT